MELGKLFELVMQRTALGRNIDQDTLGLLASDVENAILEVDSDLYRLVEQRFRAYAQSSVDGHGYPPWGLQSSIADFFAGSPLAGVDLDVERDAGVFSPTPRPDC